MARILRGGDPLGRPESGTRARTSGAKSSFDSESGRFQRTLAVERIGKVIGRASPEELAQIAKGLNEIIGT